MSGRNIERGERRGGGAVWFWAPVIVILFVGAAFSVAAYFHSEPDLTIVEAIAAGYVGVAGLILGLFGAFFGLVAAGGAVALALFIVASPALTIILLILLLSRNRSDKRAKEAV
jgi:drug/metabolite transporter (DMT)-like permease